VNQDLRTTKLSPGKIEQSIQTKFIGRKIIYLDTIDSTNSEGKRRSSTEVEGTVILSEIQTAGRGRLGREWISPKSKGIWMSILLKPKLSSEKIPQLTLVGAAAVCMALESVDHSLSGKVQIKWPNDILLAQRKLGGILTEMQVSGDKVQSVVLGIGLNVNLEKTDFPEELELCATSLSLQTGIIYERELLIAELLYSFEQLYSEFLNYGELGQSLDICRQRSAVICKQVLLLDKGIRQEAEVLDLGPQGELVVRLSNGDITSIVSGEISLRIQK